MQLVWTQQPCAAQLHLCLVKLPVATTLSLLDTVVVTRRRRRATSFAFPSGARQRARLPTVLTLNASGGTFPTSIELPGGSTSTLSIAASDLDGDGDLHVLFGNDCSSSRVLLGQHPLPRHRHCRRLPRHH